MSSPQQPESSDHSEPNRRRADFGPNEWLVDEIYQQYLADSASVDPAWWDFFADYLPTEHAGADVVAAATAARVAARAESDAAEAAQDAEIAAHDSPQPLVTTSTPAQAAPVSTAPAAVPVAQVAATPAAVVPTPIKGGSARVVANMESSLGVPTATSVRAIPAKLLIDNRIVVNNHLARGRGGKVSFTHLIGWAIVQALTSMPEMNWAFAEVDGKPAIIKNDRINLGLAIDLAKPDGSRQLLVPAIKGAESMDFATFWSTYEEVVRKARSGRLTADDFAGTTISLTNPGTIGTVHSVPRLMQGQGAIIGVGAMEYPAEWQGAALETIERHAISKTVTLTSTYDHRIIQGAQSGDFLRLVHSLLLGEQGFYDKIFAALKIPYAPIRWASDIATAHDDDLDKTSRVQELIHAFRVRGHLMADTDPLEYTQRGHADLDVSSHGLTLWDLDREFATGGFGGKPFKKLRDILGVLRDAYCRTIGIEYMHMQDPEQRAWIQERVERRYDKPAAAEQLRILRRLNAAEAFETFLQTKYVGQKRFSLEGAESVIPLMDAIITAAAESGLDEACIGMPHRGRLNVLANIAGKSYGQIFREFEGDFEVEGSVQGSGDVKYHLGTSGTFTTESGAEMPVYLAANPSHLEAVNPVLEGIVRAKQDILPRGHVFSVLPILLHGDAAFAGQGVVTETLNLSQLRGYRTGGTVHIVVNNQVGFTTAPEASRSSVYCTDVARMVQAPIFHVNGDDPEAVVRVGRLAFDFRQQFNKDVVIDLVCYRRRGHNEADDPSLTQPLMYNLIDAKRSTRKLYTEGLIGRGDISVEEAETALRDFQEQLERVFAETRDDLAHPREMSHPLPAPYPAVVATAISAETVQRVVTSQVSPPEGFTVHPRLAPQMQRRAQMVEDGTIDWALGETLAFGSLLLEGRTIRLAGQDSRRGTFGQRHAVFVDRITGLEHTPLAHLSESQGSFFVYDSLLSEYAAMGFEYGYSVFRPEALVLWEAQFGDFADGAQTIIDEFITTGEQKWGQLSGVVLLLPHGYEGQGPDHSSARIERYLQMCAQDNMTVAMPSTPASYFHLLRWQAIAPHHKPLVVFTPKSMLRLKAAGSSREDFTSGTFRPVITDATVEASTVTRVLLCTGKVTYDLLAERERTGRTDVAVVRLERLAPLPVEELTAALAAFPRDAELVFVQEEPANQGAWPYVALNLQEHLDGRVLRRISRSASSSPAVGTHKVHEREQADIVTAAFA
ncbi:MAG: multifunctional oxoglutarate decarboxylase/oxoglutarate dehydrogenase thiamine pyrophosphate-binding subunit/dihydrolipoyllysine-residue succinyltransferase subunit [Actinobacteria bacterium]|uniref:oxoglutarate dehydrogenase (succinyl-transferring) n=1 Tax=freshwater metagenome TaxID=449393 RepID=A0A6J7QUX0_9ZZZZ|nr:multifunctional oxoglutarate decarboxylase/oxoglutarate dehydrogenase thiamine pyrophosphate-binding subunit/dihydrolipoyllysine-residue succinyltransferase subunit [Actinomycetota bacterium]